MSESLEHGTGFIELTDGTILKLKITIVDIKEVGFSPFGGVNLDIKAIGGIATHYVPESLRKSMVTKPLISSELPKDGWEIIDIRKQNPAVIEEVVNTSKGKFKVKVEAEVTMVARNMKYRTRFNEPVYWASWVWKISWKPIREQTKR